MQKKKKKATTTQPKNPSKWIWPAGSCRKSQPGCACWARGGCGEGDQGWLPKGPWRRRKRGQLWLRERTGLLPEVLGRDRSFIHTFCFSGRSEQVGTNSEVHPFWELTWQDTAFKEKPMSPTPAGKHKGNSFCPAWDFSLGSSTGWTKGYKFSVFNSENFKHLASGTRCLCL